MYIIFITKNADRVGLRMARLDAVASYNLSCLFLYQKYCTLSVLPFALLNPWTIQRELLMSSRRERTKGSRMRDGPEAKGEQ